MHPMRASILHGLPQDEYLANGSVYGVANPPLPPPCAVVCRSILLFLSMQYSQPDGVNATSVPVPPRLSLLPPFLFRKPTLPISFLSRQDDPKATRGSRRFGGSLVEPTPCAEMNWSHLIPYANGRLRQRPCGAEGGRERWHARNILPRSHFA
ncbi:uncharacterized protein LY79DRAFT_556423 [Colletotrichum navitas]|uniref:Uncharacterized protein n=1 Tax=Colletotrichum navitas TaxID=681940 RepID=A0AAD8V533_9PEZI|nr:uncharacterized protein LY79DRAFT_556423 [Colletotrichum navitas]KAK1589833.1 hypothetical protein LY79DRAFT_556423 [Colletotrichum navitas]